MLNTEKCSRYRNLRRWLKNLKIPYKDISLALGMPIEIFSKKIQGEDGFTLQEAVKIRSFIVSKVTISYLFEDGRE